MKCGEYYPGLLSNQGIITERKGKGKERISMVYPPSTNLLSSAFFKTDFIYLYKTSYLDKEVNCTEASPSVKK
jgi:hypothetical protein